jgi:polar amino acid transport system ATP-binding protein
MVTVTNLTIFLRKKPILTEVSCTLLPGRITLFLGKSGAGKTTLLKSIGGLIPLSSGTITLGHDDITGFTASQRAEKIGYVFQEFNLFPHLTALENCTDPLLLQGTSTSDAQAQATALLTAFGLEKKLDSYPAQLSGGQQQRIALARALCLQPNVLLCDEPTASLDPHNTDLLVTLLQSLAQQGLTIAVSTQDMSFAKKIVDRAYLLEEGTIIEACESKKEHTTSPFLHDFLQ